MSYNMINNILPIKNVPASSLVWTVITKMIVAGTVRQEYFYKILKWVAAGVAPYIVIVFQC